MYPSLAAQQKEQLFARTRVGKIKFTLVLRSLTIPSYRQCSKSEKGTGNSTSKIAKALKVGRETKQRRTRGKPRPDKITEMSSLSFLLSLPFLAFFLTLCVTSCISVLRETVFFIHAFSLSPRRILLPLPLHPCRSISVTSVRYQERISERNANTSIFNETTGDKENSLTHADVDNPATGANLHTSILTNFSPAARRRFRLPSLAPPHWNGFMRGRRRFSLGRLDYLRISLKYGTFVAEKFAVRICAVVRSSSDVVTFQIQTIFNFSIIAWRFAQVIFFYVDLIKIDLYLCLNYIIYIDFYRKFPHFYRW